MPAPSAGAKWVRASKSPSTRMQAREIGQPQVHDLSRARKNNKWQKHLLAWHVILFSGWMCQNAGSPPVTWLGQTIHEDRSLPHTGAAVFRIELPPKVVIAAIAGLTASPVSDAADLRYSGCVQVLPLGCGEDCQVHQQECLYHGGYQGSRVLSKRLQASKSALHMLPFLKHLVLSACLYEEGTLAAGCWTQSGTDAVITMCTVRFDISYPNSRRS